MREISGILKLIPRSEIGRLVFLITLIVVVSIVEVIGIGALIPFIMAVFDPSKVYQEIMVYFPSLKHYLNENNLSSMLAATFVALIIFANFLRSFTTYSQSMIIRTIGVKIASNLVNSLLSSPRSEATTIAEVTASATSRVGIMVSNGIKPAVSVLCSTLTLMLMIVFVFQINREFFIIIFSIISLMYGVILLVFRRPLTRVSRAMNKGQRDVQETLRSSFQAGPEILLYGNHGSYVDSYARAENNFRTAVAKIAVLSQIPRYIIEAVIMTSFVFYVVVSFKLGWISDTDEFVARLAASVFALQKSFPLAQSIYASVSTIRGSAKTIEQISQSLDLASWQSETKFADQPSIKVKDVTYTYDTRRHLFNGLNLSFEAGKVYWLRGPSGSGKSTLIKLLLGFLKPTYGTISVTTTGKHKLGYVPQNVSIIHGSVFDNIKFGRKYAADSQIISAAEKAKVTEFISDTGRSIKDSVGDGGNNFSGGQRQRIGLARALVNEPEILILDETFSGVSPEVEQRIMLDLKHSLASAIVIITSHRPISYSDEIIDL